MDTRFGKKLHIVIPAGEVKNNVDLEFELPDESARLIAIYLEHYRNAPKTNRALFPGKVRDAKSLGTLRGQIKKVVHDYTGLEVNPHLFRHIGAQAYLTENPGGYEVVRRVLAHKSMATTASFYTGLETRQAGLHYAKTIEACRTSQTGGLPVSGGPHGRGKSPECACMKLELWPAKDRELWRAAMAPVDPFEEEGGSRHGYRPHSNRKVEAGYGRWLTFLSRQDLLDPASRPADRISRERVIAYVRELDHLHNSRNTVLSRLQELADMAKTLAPDRDWSFISRISARVRASTAEQNDKRQRMVGSDRLLSLGLALMEVAEQQSTPRLAAMSCRDGLIIALLALVPMRRGNLSSLAMGTSLIKNADQWAILITGEISKNHDALEYAWPEMLVPQLQTYLQVHRPVLASQVHHWTADIGNHLWVSSHGSPMTEMAIYDTIAKRTRAAFGTAINPHLFRDEAATALAIHDPAHVRSAAPLLGHRQLSTTERYYQQAQSLQAQRELADVIERMRHRQSGKGVRRDI